MSVNVRACVRVLRAVRAGGRAGEWVHLGQQITGIRPFVRPSIQLDGWVTRRQGTEALTCMHTHLHMCFLQVFTSFFLGSKDADRTPERATGMDVWLR